MTPREILSLVGALAVSIPGAQASVLQHPGRVDDPVPASRCDCEQIAVDIKPASASNPIDLFRDGIIVVAVLGSAAFDVADVDADTLAFGPGGAPLAHGVPPTALDRNDDGLTDLLTPFLISETGIVFGDEEACVTGELLDGTEFEGCDLITTLPPPEPTSTEAWAERSSPWCPPWHPPRGSSANPSPTNPWIAPTP